MQSSIFYLIMSLQQKYTTVIIFNFATAAFLALLVNVCTHILFHTQFYGLSFSIEVQK